MTERRAVEILKVFLEAHREAERTVERTGDAFAIGVARARNMYGLTTRALAEPLGMSPQSVLNWTKRGLHVMAERGYPIEDGIDDDGDELGQRRVNSSR